MKRGLNNALDECLTLLEKGQATLEQCLARYPKHASDLRPLLEVALEVSRVPRPASSPAAFAACKQQMLKALAEKKRQRSVSPSPLRRYARRIAALFGRRERPAVRRRAPAFPLALAAVVALALFTVAGLFLSPWLGLTVAQAATLGQVNGVVEVMPAGSEAWRQASVGERVEAGDRIRTGSLSAATLTFFDRSKTDLEAETEITVAQMSSRRDGRGKVIVLHQSLGRTFNRVKRRPDVASRFEIETPTAVTVVRGTVFVVDVTPHGTTHVTVGEGLVEVTAQEMTVAVLAGQKTTVQPEQPPSNPNPVLWATATSAPLPTATPTPGSTLQTHSRTRTLQPPGQTKTPQPPGQTKTPQPPGHTKTPQPPGHTKTPQPPGHTKTPQPPGHTKTPQPPGHTKTPQPPGHTKTP
jgi:hypothetical protein